MPSFSYHEVMKNCETLKAQIATMERELQDAQTQVEYLRDKLNDAQERNRKLDWLLAKAVESL